jgi:hypothetical protein
MGKSAHAAWPVPGANLVATWRASLEAPDGPALQKTEVMYRYSDGDLAMGGSVVGMRGMTGQGAIVVRARNGFSDTPLMNDAPAASYPQMEVTHLHVHSGAADTTHNSARARPKCCRL